MSDLERDFVGYGRRPPDPRWPGGAILALNIVVNVEEGSEPSIGDGDPESETALTEGGGGGFRGRDLAAESMYEYGSRVGFWRVLRILEDRRVPATMFTCAVALERNQEIAAAIREGGYDVCCHGYRWERHQWLDEAQERERIALAVDSLNSNDRKSTPRLVLSLWAQRQHAPAPGGGARIYLRFRCLQR